MGLNWYFYKNTRLTFNCEWRDQEVSNPQAITNATQCSNAELFAVVLHLVDGLIDLRHRLASPFSVLPSGLR